MLARVALASARSRLESGEYRSIVVRKETLLRCVISSVLGLGTTAIARVTSLGPGTLVSSV